MMDDGNSLPNDPVDWRGCLERRKWITSLLLLFPPYEVLMEIRQYKKNKLTTLTILTTIRGMSNLQRHSETTVNINYDKIRPITGFIAIF